MSLASCQAIDVPTEKLHFVSQVTCTPAELSGHISSTDPRFSLYRYRFPSAQAVQQTGNGNSAIIFIYTCPSSSKIKERMVYASSRARIVQYAEQDAGLKIAKRVSLDLTVKQPGLSISLVPSR